MQKHSMGLTYSNDSDSEVEIEELVLCDSLNDADSLTEMEALN